MSVQLSHMVRCSRCGKEFPVPINNCYDDIIDQLICYKCVKLLAMKSLRKKFMQRVYPEGTKVLHRFKDCGTGIVLWANDEHIAVHFENGDEYAYRPENIKRLEYPIR